MSAITIRIHGNRGAGKSTLAQRLAVHLKEIGMDVSVFEPGTKGIRNEVPIKGAPFELQRRRIDIEVRDEE